MSANDKGGRPKGAANATEKTEAVATRCPICGSTHRTTYRTLAPIEASGNAPDGRPFNSVYRARCHCVDCGTPRIELVYHYDPAADPKNARPAKVSRTDPPEGE